MKKIVIYLICILFCNAALIAQTTQYDHTLLSPGPAAATEQDASSLKGTVIKKAAGSGDATAWYGPYRSLQAGVYQIQFRLKVSSKNATTHLCILDVSSNISGLPPFASLVITPSMFTKAMEWQTFTLDNVSIPGSYSDVEFRGMDFRGSAGADIYLDYINVVRMPDFFVSNFLVTGNGKVGIGTTNPRGQLAVNGDIYCKKVNVTVSGWADYVFHKDYKLQTLKEVEDYIKQNSHLPGVPSAEEVERDGVELGANQATLLKKIEELTLYAIEQNKQLEKQQQQLKEQQALILQLGKLMNSQQEQIKKLEKRNLK